ncbi:HlyD family efflux transporter periplasmic adaptor subunit [Hymenobacter aquaticus]|uniref:HlyD family efflux transporter periplasmic adaptor subunit n=1 Tax=Hymenobacter aquaticus TaxID=1867101 RepID=A0A4Z0PUJ7_9BACT|nr:HlyD family efflux transporter periplasmic adaptor subunit [Hymenobacter aquaticus]TGE21460.1 HlyD family efflux transporter periplasmic adaptor subunit [Hymenobacter aquaticus]
MALKIDELDERSEIVRDVIGQPPAWPIRWGSMLIFLIIALAVIMSAIIRYPDTIIGQVQISTTEPPIRITAPVDAQIRKLFVVDGQFVQEGVYIAETRSVASGQSMSKVREVISQVEAFIKNPKPDFVPTNPYLTLGDAQLMFNSLQKDVRDYTSFLRDNYFAEQIKTLESQIADYKSLDGVSKIGKGIKLQNLQQAKERFQAQKLLYKDKVISKFDFFQEESRYNEVKQSFEAARESELENNILITANTRQIKQLRFDAKEQERKLRLNVQQSLLNLKNQMSEWEQKNVFISPIAGKVSYLKRIVDKQYVKAQEELFAIVPADSNYIAIVNVPTTGYGKVAVGQRVQIRLENYPTVQFGVLVGKIRKLSYLANEKTYFAEVMLPKGLTTNYLKTLPYHPEMGGIAEIVTEDLSLLERIFYSIREIFGESFSKRTTVS